MKLNGIEKLIVAHVSAEDICPSFCADYSVFVLNIATQDCLTMLKQYLYDMMKSYGAYNLEFIDRLTAGHEVLLFFDTQCESYYWAYGNGSIEDLLKFQNDNIIRIIKEAKDDKRGGIDYEEN